MKKFKNYFMLCVVAFCCTVAFNSCGDDDDDIKGGNSKIVGLWETTHSKGWEKVNGKTTDSWDESFTDERMEINSDGTAVLYEQYGNSWQAEITGTWKLKGDKLTFTADGEVQTMEIERLNETTLVIEVEEKYKEDGDTYEYHDEITYRRIR